MNTLRSLTIGRLLASVLLSVAVPAGVLTVTSPAEAACKKTSITVVIPLTQAKHRQIIAHANWAIKISHYPRVMILNRPGADARRRAALKSFPAKTGFDRDEYPAAVGRKVNKAHLAYVNPTQNRSAGAVMGNTLRPYCNGTHFRYAGT